ncbi:hypothetical protein [Mucilaginibacter paludis]|uniref:Uncharacterized protein n=1 Tax=Mucilaginibacter paludis DSM 18603 TaxID=714943 RepID=H1YDC0_9SPHI|nr:hypothetical protein [Mucilaginibacter paludis]EHQ27146.1 hypothetical protein Mucpa_3041 [Mucilaginibacter paludis DSM 18603]
MYDSRLKYKWDNQNVLDYAVNKAREEGREQAREEVQIKLVKNLIIQFDFPDEQIAQAIEVSVDLVKKSGQKLTNKRLTNKLFLPSLITG